MSPAPATSGPFSDHLYASFRPLAVADEGNGWALLHYLSAVGAPFALVYGLAYDSDDGPGWSALVDLARAPTWALPWLAQLSGARLRAQQAGEDEEAYWDAMRLRISSVDGRNRGGPEAFALAAVRHLTGSRYVILNERAGGSAYRVAVRTLTSETPDPGLVEAALLEQKPAGIVLDYEVVPGATYSAHEAAFDTYADFEAAFATYIDAEENLP